MPYVVIIKRVEENRLDVLKRSFWRGEGKLGPGSKLNAI